MMQILDEGRSGKRILMISTHGYFKAEPSFSSPDTGGQVAYVIELSLALAKFGYKVDILTRQLQDFPQIEEVNEEVRIIRIPCGGRDFIPKEYLVNYLPELVDGFVTYCGDNGLKYEFVDSHYWDAGFVGMEIARIFDVPHIFTPHSIGTWKKMEMERAALEQGITLNEGELERQNNFNQRIETEKVIMNQVNKVVATTLPQKDIICDRYDISGKKLAIITPGFDPDKYRRMEEHSLKKAIEKHRLPPRFVLAVGRITPYKGYDLLLQAMKCVVKAMPDIKLLLRIGSQQPSQSEGQIRNELLQATKDLDLMDNVLFYDYIEEIEVLYNAAEVLVLPSTYEPFGMVAIEAMACGTPTVLSTKGGLKYLLQDRQEALFVDPVDTQALAEAILNLLGDRTRHDEISRNGCSKVHSRFTWDMIAKRILKTIW